MNNDRQNDNSVIIFYPDGTHYTPAPTKAKKHVQAISKSNTRQVTSSKATKESEAVICYPDGTTQPLQDSSNEDSQVLSVNINKRFNQIIDFSLPNSNLNQYFRDHYNDCYNFIFKGEQGGIYKKMPLIAYIRSLIQKQQEKVNDDTSHFWNHMLDNHINKEQRLIQKLVSYSSDTLFILTQNLFGYIVDCHAVTKNDIKPLKDTLRDYIMMMTPVSKWKELMP